jgi:DUF917 family protein/N-methylhydantoinase A/oxoprolinase/acetone carboxylase beta subunit
VLASYKTPTTSDTTIAVESAIREVIASAKVDHAAISSVTIGTTAFLNAVIERERSRLSRVAVLRLSKSFLRDVRPFSDWPVDLAEAIRGYIGYVDGGLHIDGSEEAPIVEEQVVAQCREIRERGLSTVVIAGVYSPIDQEFHQEDRVRDIVAREIPGADIVCSHEVANIGQFLATSNPSSLWHVLTGSAGFLERENASIINAAILRFARQTIRGFQAAIWKLDLPSHCPLYLTQNDGTLLDAASAARVPIRTFSSGVTNSMRGAAYLSGLASGSEEQEGSGESAIVVDIGGTTTDVGVMLPSGLPRQASAYVSVAGVKVNYSLPHLHSIGLGGGSVIKKNDNGGGVVLGPESVGHELHLSLAFGGSVATATDVAVAAGLARVGTHPVASEDLDKGFVSNTLARVKAMLEEAIDTVKTSPDPMPVLLTGGGSVLAPENIEGASTIIRPPFHDVANAVGAACSKVGSTIDIIQNTSERTMAEATEDAKRMAIEKVVSAGALQETVYIARVDVMPIPYLDNQVRSVVTAIGELDISRLRPSIPQAVEDDDEETHSASPPAIPIPDARSGPSIAEAKEDHWTYRPKVQRNPTTGIPEWHISTTDLEYIADGCYLLGCGGGGNPEAGKLQLRDMLSNGHGVRVIDAQSLDPASVVYWGGRMGSPAAISERLQAHETVLAMRALASHLRHTNDENDGTPMDAITALEIGGSNGLEPFLCGSTRFFDRPVVDGDFMGRANPMCWQTTLTVHRPGEFVPCAIDSGAGRTMLMTAAPRDEAVDKPLRGAIAEMGSLVGLAPRPTTGEAVQNVGVLRSVSLAWRIGRAMARAEGYADGAPDAIVKEVGGAGSAKVLFRGKVAGVDRTLSKGHSVGVLRIVADTSQARAAGPDEETVGELRIPFINENILAEHVASDGTTKVIATVPDLICLIDRDTGRAVGVPEYRYGCHVVVLGIACSPRWTETPRGLDVGGPKGYGYDLEYTPLGKYSQPRSVIDEFLQRGVA